MTDNRIQYTEKMVGAGHPSLADTLNRLALVEHNNDGAHKYVYILASAKGAASGVAELDASSLILLSRLPTVLIGKDADTVDGFHGGSLAKVGANADITSLAGLTTPLSRPQGGTGYAQAVSPLFAVQNTPVALTGNTNETELFSFIIPGGTLGLNGVLRIMTLWSFTNSANVKTGKTKFGGTTWFNQGGTNSSMMQQKTIIRNRNSQSSQVGSHLTVNTFGMYSGVNPTVASINTAIDQSLSVTGQLANAGETITLESVFVEVLK